MAALAAGSMVHPRATTSSPAPAPAPAPVAPLDLDTFSRRVLEAARSSPTGRFGDDKVFVVHVCRILSHDPVFAAMGLDGFKRRLAEANNARLLDLSRADMVEAMDPDDVALSKVSYLGAAFHFVRILIPVSDSHARPRPPHRSTGAPAMDQVTPAEPDDRPRVAAFCSPERPEVFHAVAYRSDIWKDDPFDVETIHEEARDAFERLVHRAARARRGRRPAASSCSWGRPAAARPT